MGSKYLVYGLHSLMMHESINSVWASSVCLLYMFGLLLQLEKLQLQLDLTCIMLSFVMETLIMTLFLYRIFLFVYSDQFIQN